MSIRELNDHKSDLYTQLYEEAVDEFYGAYSPNIYSRTWSLYGLAEFESTDEYFEIDFDESQMSAPSEYLMDTVFASGYHGGALHDGVYRYRKPHPYYTHWGRAAIQTTSPYTLIKSKIQEYESSQMQDDFNDIFYRNFNDLFY